jgi:hypothetical protein
MHTSVLFLFTLLSLVFTSPLHAFIIHVPGDSTTIQGGINGAVDGDTVMVWPGTYPEHDIDLLGKAITVMSTDPEDSLVVNATIVDAGALGNVFTFHSGEDSTCVLAGLTITGGSAVAGGGIFCVSSSPIIRACAIVNNESTGSSRPNGGGGIYCEESFIQVRDCTINLNFAQRGGGIKSHNSSPTIQNCTIRENVTTPESGGGINFTESSNVVVRNCRIVDNVSGHGGGGITCSDGTNYWIVNTVIVGNTAATHLGGGFHSRGSAQPTVENCTITGNSASSGDGVMNVSTTPDILNCIIWDNGTEEIGNSAGGNPTVTYCDVKGGWPGEGNIDEDPLFMSYKGYNYLLDAGSPCIDAGDPSIEDLISDWHPDWPNWLPNGSRSDMGAYGGPGNKNWWAFR